MNDRAPAAPGSIADIVARLEVWSLHAPRGLARVHADSEYARREVVRRLADRLKAEEIPFHEIDLPVHRPPTEAVRALIERLSGLEAGVVSISGFATAFPDDGLADFLRVLNFNRESLSDFPLCQVWWLTGNFLDAFLRVAPDLNSWFLIRLQLSEEVQPPRDRGALSHDVIGERTDFVPVDESLRRISALLARVRVAVSAESHPDRILELAGVAARAIHAAGVPKLTRKFADELHELVRPIVENFGFKGSSDFAMVSDLADLFDALNRWPEAAAAYERALEISRGSGDRLVEARVLNNLGTAYQSQGQWSRAVDAIEQALRIGRDLGDRMVEARSLNNLGIAYGSQGRWSEALDAHQRALAIKHDLGDRAAEGRALNNVGTAYQSQGRWPEAIVAFERALAISREYHDLAGQGRALNNVGITYQSQGRWPEAVVAFERALAIKREIGDRVGEGQTFVNLGAAYDFQGRWSEALDAYQRAIAIERDLGDRVGEGSTLYNLALLWAAQGDIPKALERARQAAAILEGTEARKDWEDARELVARLEAGGD